MQQRVHDTNGILGLVRGLYSYLEEIDGYRKTCERHAESTAIHTKGQELQVYRLFPRCPETAKMLRSSVDKLPSWVESPYWKANSENLNKLERDVEGRMSKHERLNPIVTKGISWQSKPLLVHAYKFEPDPVMKIELIALHPKYGVPELPIANLAKILECHDFLVPEYQAKPLPPYHRHETEFQTLWEYLSLSMPKDLYATQCFPQPTQK